MTTKARQQTLEQRISQGVAVHQFYFDDYRTVADQHIRCSWCEGALLIDYLGLGVLEMNRRLSSWVAVHAKCEPRLVTKTKDMVLAPVEGKR